MATYSQTKPAGTPTWLDLLSPDADKARDFYKTVFGWDYDISGPEYGGYTVARVGNTSVAGLSGPFGDQPMPSAWSVYFATDHIDADVARAVELGATLVAPPMTIGSFGSMATCIDPTGAPFSYWQGNQHVGAQLMMEPGSAAWFELYTSDVKKARDFYAALMRLDIDTMPGDMEYYMLKRGDEHLCGIMHIDPSWGDVSPMWGIYFAVENTDETVAVITSLGGKIMGKAEDTPFGRMAAMADPAGATFNIIQADGN